MKNYRASTRAEKYKHYREKIDNHSFIAEQQEDLYNDKTKLESKHNKGLNTLTTPKKDKTVNLFKIYQRNKNFRIFLYVLLDVVVIALVVFVILLIGNTFLGFNLW